MDFTSISYLPLRAEACVAALISVLMWPSLLVELRVMLSLGGELGETPSLERVEEM